MKTINERLLESIQNYCEREFDDVKYESINDMPTIINLAYTTTESGKHEVQVDFDIESLEWQEYIDGKLMMSAKRGCLEDFIDELDGCSFESIVSDILEMAEEMEERENE